MKSKTRLVAAAVGLALALPAVASAHPGVYTVTAKINKTAERQILTLSGGASGNWKPSAQAGTVSVTATAAEVQTALIQDTSATTDPAIGYDNVRVTGAAGGPYTVEFVGTLAGTAVAALVPTNPDGGGTVTVDADNSAPSQDGGATITYTDLATVPTDQARMANQDQTVVASDGYAIGYRETNGVGPVVDGGGVYHGSGILNLKELPGTYRTPITETDWLKYGPAQSGIQLHATCQGVSALDNPSNVLAAWGLTVGGAGDPFYNYIPWQKTSAGLGDEPDTWIAEVKTLTGVDLASLSTVGEFTSACSSVGGTYKAADTASNITSSVVADAVAAATDPLNAQITSLTAQLAMANGQVTTLTADKKKLSDDNAALIVARDTLQAAKDALDKVVKDLQTRPLTLTLTGSKLRLRNVVAMVTGRAGDAVTARLLVSRTTAKKLGLSSRVLGQAKATIDTAGAALLSIRPTSKAAKALAKHKGKVAAGVVAKSGTETDSATAILTR